MSHYVRERATAKMKLVHLPYTVQLHKGEPGVDPNYYLFGAGRLVPSEESLRSTGTINNTQELMAK